MSSPRSFCMVTTFYPPYHFGGEATYIYNLTNALAERGHRVTVVHCLDAYRALTKAGPRGEFPHHPNVTVVSLHSRLGTLSPTLTYLTGRPALKARRLSEVFESERFDVTHFHLSTLVGGPGVLSYGRGVKLYTVHDHWLVCPMYDLWRDNREECIDPHCFRCTLRSRRPPQLWRYTGLLERQVPEIDFFLMPSRSAMEQHRRRGFTAPMRHLPHFLPGSASLESVETGPLASRPYFLFAGRLVKQKGAQTLIDVFRRYRGADLVIAGDGPYEHELRSRAAGLDNVHFVGRASRDQLHGLYDGAVAVLVPSLVYETFGLVALEAFARRTPVIARDFGAVPELIIDSGGGFTYGTATELVDAMDALRQNAELRHELGDRGYRGYLEHWTQEAHLSKYFELIDEVRDGGTPAAAAPCPPAAHAL